MRASASMTSGSHGRPWRVPCLLRSRFSAQASANSCRSTSRYALVGLSIMFGCREAERDTCLAEQRGEVRRVLVGAIALDQDVRCRGFDRIPPCADHERGVIRSLLGAPDLRLECFGDGDAGQASEQPRSQVTVARVGEWGDALELSRCGPRYLVAFGTRGA